MSQQKRNKSWWEDEWAWWYALFAWSPVGWGLTILAIITIIIAVTI